MKYTGLLLLLIVVACGQEKHPQKKAIITEERTEPDSSLIYWERYSDLREYTNNYFDSLNKIAYFNGVYALAINSNKVAEGYIGLATPQRDSLGQHHRFQLASATKPFTALAIMQLYEKNKLQLSDTIGKFLPRFPYHHITIQQLLSHYGGLSEYPYFTDFVADSLDYIDNEWVVRFMQDSVPDYYYPAGRKHDYSNTGYMLLAHLIEKISGMEYPEYMKKFVFQPAQMNNTFVYYPGALEKEDSLAWGMIGKKLYRSGNEYLNGVYGDKGIYSTSSDMLAFAKALDKNILISDSSLLLMQTAIYTDQQNKKAYGLGWRILYPHTDSTLIYHTGWWQGSRSYFIRDVKRKHALVVLDNLKYGPFLDVMQLMDIFDHQKLETTKQIH